MNHISDADLSTDLERGKLLIEMRDLAFAIADELCAFDIESNHYTAVVDQQEWRDLKMLHNADHKACVERARRYLELRGLLIHHPTYPNLVRVAELPILPPADAAEEASV